METGGPGSDKPPGPFRLPGAACPISPAGNAVNVQALAETVRRLQQAAPGDHQPIVVQTCTIAHPVPWLR